MTLALTKKTGLYSMIGIIVATHCTLADSLIESAEFIFGNKLENVSSVSINLNEKAEDLKKKISKSMKQVDQKAGIIILTDMFGGTPSNLSYSYLEEGKVEVIAGCNLPMLIKAVNTQNEADLSKAAKSIQEYGKRSVTLASGVIKGDKRS